MTTSLLIVAFFVSSIIGYLLVSLIMYDISDHARFVWVKITLGVGVGYGVTSILSFIWQIVIGGFNVFYPAFELVLAVALYLGWRKIIKRQRNNSVPVFFEVGRRSYWVVLLQFSLGSGLLLGVITFILGTIVAPNGMWDAWMVQNRVARFLYIGGDYWTNAFSPLLVSADYPLLTGLSVARLWRYAERETFLATALFAFTITFSLIGFLISSVAYFRGRIFSYVAGLVLLTSSALFVFAPAQLADIPIAFYFLATIVLLRIHEDTPSSHRSLLFLTGVTSALALWTKNEGWLFVIAIFISYFIAPPFLIKKPFQMEFIMRFALGLLPVFLVAIFFKLVFAPAYDFLRHQPADISLAERLLDPSRYLIAIRSYLIQLYDLTPDRSTPLIALFFIALLFGIDRKRITSAGFISVCFVLMVMITGEFVIYLLSPNELQWQISSSIHRLFLQLWPLCVFEVMMLIKVPDSMG